MEQKNYLRVLDFTEYPGPRYCEQGNNSGEEFYHKKLNLEFKNALENNIKLTVDLDKTAGYASSFLDEAFGNLVFDFSLEKVKNNIEIISNEEKDWITMIFDMVMPDWEKRRNENKPPKKTQTHEAWYRFIGNTIECRKWL